MEQQPQIQIHRFTWQGIEIEAIYAPEKWGGVIAHLEIRSIKPERAPLPITETGYRSHFHPCGTVEANGGATLKPVGKVHCFERQEAPPPKRAAQHIGRAVIDCRSPHADTASNTTATEGL